MSDNDLIRRGDAIAIFSAASRTAQKTIDAIAALPAAQADYEGRILSALEWKTTVSPEVQALVDAATKARIILAEFEPHPLPVLGELLAALAALKDAPK